MCPMKPFGKGTSTINMGNTRTPTPTGRTGSTQLKLGAAAKRLPDVLRASTGKQQEP